MRQLECRVYRLSAHFLLRGFIEGVSQVDCVLLSILRESRFRLLLLVLFFFKALTAERAFTELNLQLPLCWIYGEI